MIENFGNNARPRISIVCVYNNIRILQEVLSYSLKSQTFRDFELISIDNTQNDYQSAAEALNYGVTIASGDFIIFVHQDIMFYSTDAISTLWRSVNELDALDSPVILGSAGAVISKTRIGRN